jgi:hypothetical protein
MMNYKVLGRNFIYVLYIPFTIEYIEHISLSEVLLHLSSD